MEFINSSGNNGSIQERHRVYDCEILFECVFNPYYDKEDDRS